MLKWLRVKSSVILLMIIIVISLLLGGCSGVSGSFHTLNELYQNESITRADIMNIAALRTGSAKSIKDAAKTPWELEEVVCVPVEAGAPLSDDVQKKIKQDFKVDKENKQKANLSEYNLVKYYGTYGGYIVVEINYKMSGIDAATVMLELAASDIYLGQISASSEIIAWREKTN